MKVFAAAAVTLANICSTDAKNIPQSVGLPTEGAWTSLTETIEFLPASDEGSPLLRQEQRRILSYFSEHFVDGQETQYNEYAQVWRFLGMYVDCDAAVDDERRHRRLDEGGDNAEGEAEGGEEGEQDGEEYQQAQDGEQDDAEEEEVQEEEDDDGNVCVRRLLWAAVSPTSI